MHRLSLAFLATLVWAATASSTEVANRLPDMELSNLEGDRVDVAAIADGDVLLLDFWATWCAPCRRAMPVYAELEAKYGEHGFRVVTVNQDRRRDQARVGRALEKMKVEFPVLLDPDEELGRVLGVLSLPTSFLVLGDGQIHSGHVGYLPGDEKALEAEIRLLLGLDDGR